MAESPELPHAGDHQDDDPSWAERLELALHSVAIPDGLQDRIRARVRAEAAAPEPSLADPVSPDSSVVGVEMVEAATEVVASGRPDLPTTVVSKRSWTARRWVQPVVAASVLLLLAGGVYLWTRPVSAHQLAQHCLQQLDLTDSIQWTQDGRPDFSYLQTRMRFPRSLRVIGVVDSSPGGFGRQCRTWKLSDETGAVSYVFEFLEPAAVSELGPELAIIRRQSGHWSLVACQTPERLWVVATSGDPSDLLRSARLA